MRSCILLLALALAMAVACAQNAPGRQVTQTVFDAAGNPAAGARVTASYCLGRAATFQHATADGNGVVIWNNLPAAPVIVWGEQVPASVIPANAVTVTTQLPAPKPQEKVNCIFTSAGAAQGHQTYFIVRQGGGNTISGSASGRDNSWLVAGVPTTLTAVSVNPSGMATFGTVYLPYPVGGSAVEFTFDIAQGPVVHGRFALANGMPVPAVSKLGIVPEQLSAVAPSDLQAVQRRMSVADALIPLFLYPDGHFTLQLPAPGTYRLQVDLFDQNMPSIPALALQVKPGEQEMVITLPDPLLTVPAGSQVCWIPKNAPMNSQRLLVPATQPQMPVFGPKDGLLALWYNPTPNTMALLAGTATPRLLTKRQVRLSVRDTNGVPYILDHDPWRPRVSLLSMFPPMREGEGAMLDSRPNHRTLPEFSRLRSTGDPWTLNLWSGTYTVMVGPEGLYGKADMDRITCLLPMTVSAGDDAEITLKDPGVPLPKPSIRADVPAPPLCTIAGRLLHADGTPYANTRFTIKSALAERSNNPNLPREVDKVVVNGATDADGRFTVANAPSGAVALMLPSVNDRWSCWQFVAPPIGIDDITLQARVKQMVFFIDNSASMSTQIWWVPEKGTPLRIPGSGQYACTDTVPQEAGFYWNLNTATGAGKCIRYLPGMPFDSYALGEVGIPLAVYLPLDLTQGFPGAITLTGTGERQGMRVVIAQPVWSPVSLRSLMVTQLDAVPPGSYTVTVETARGPITQAVTVTSSGGYVQF